jgi:NADH-quinone oxidoreductase subunit N
MSVYFSIILSGFAIISLTVGCFGALIQTSLKRFFAYTSINQSGFIIMGLLTNSIFGLEASILYIIVYMLSNILFFYAVDNIASDDLTEVNNLTGIKRMSLGVALFSMAGVPPLLGFGSKYFV